MINVPFSASVLTYSALALLLVGLFMLLVFIGNRVGRILRRLQRKPVKRVSFIASTLRLFLILLLLAAAGTLLCLGAFIQSYTVYTQRELAATVHCAPVPGTSDQMVLELAMPKTPTTEQVRRYLLRGQQWSIEGHILTWDPWLNFLGLKTMYKLTRVRGRYLRADEEMNKPATVYSLVPREDDPRWRWLYLYGPRLPFVQAVYGNTVFTFPAEGKTFAIYVTQSGFMIVEDGLVVVRTVEGGS
jgi:hypothetical protein